MCYALLLVKYRNGTSADDKPVMCKDEADLAIKLKDVQGRPEAVQVDVFQHNPHTSIQLIQEWRPRSGIVKPPTSFTNE